MSTGSLAAGIVAAAGLALGAVSAYLAPPEWMQEPPTFDRPPAFTQQISDWDNPIHSRYQVPVGAAPPREYIRYLWVMGPDRTGDGKPDPVLGPDYNGDGKGDPMKAPVNVFTGEPIPRPSP